MMIPQDCGLRISDCGLSEDSETGNPQSAIRNPQSPRDYPDDRPDKLKEMALETEFTFPICYDETQEAAKAFSAACTPDFFLFDEARKLVYRGQLDDSRPGNAIPVTGKDLRAALDALLSGQRVGQEQRPSIGCNIKWKPGNNPPYFR